MAFFGVSSYLFVFSVSTLAKLRDIDEALSSSQTKYDTITKMSEVEEKIESVLCFLNKIITDPDFLPTSEMYVDTAYLSFELCTKYAGIFSNPAENPCKSPFEELYNFLESTFTQVIEQNLKIPQDEENTIQNIESQLRTYSKRVNIINHVFSNVYMKKRSFINIQNIYEPQDLISAQLYTKCYKDYLPMIIEKHIEECCEIFSSKEHDFSILSSLIYLIDCTSKIVGRDVYVANVKELIIPKFRNLFDRFIDCDINLMIFVVMQLYNFTDLFQNRNTTEQIRLQFYQAIIMPRLSEIVDVLKKFNFTDLFATDSVINEKNLLKVLSFVINDYTIKLIEEFYESFVKDFVSSFAQETNIRNLAASMLKLMQLNDSFLCLLYDNSGMFVKITRQKMAEALHAATYCDKFGKKFPTALAFIVDAYLKRGNAFKNTVKQTHISRLLSLVTERDIFVTHHHNNLFLRLVTRSTIGIEHERNFLESIAGVVMEENIEKSINLLNEANEHNEPSIKQFYYITIKNSSAPRDLIGPNIPLPIEYEKSVKEVNVLLKKRFPTKVHDWVHYFSTVEFKMMTKAGVSLITASLGQFNLLQSFVKSSQLSGKEIYSIVAMDPNYVDLILRTLLLAKIITIVKGSKENMTNATFAINSKFQQKKAVIADNWTPRVVKVKNLGPMRTQATEAAIVKIMKKARMMKTQELVEKVMFETSHLFPITIAEIHQCIQHLIAGAYLEQSDDTHMSYLEL